MKMVGRIQRYVFKECLMALLLTLGVIILAILLVDVVEQMRTIGNRTQITILTAFSLSLMKAPGLIMETLPFATLIGSILAFSQLSRRSEIPAIRAAGVSAWRFLGPAMALSFVLGVLMVTVIDPLATRLNLRFEAERQRLINPRATETAGGAGGVWLSQGGLLADSGSSVATDDPGGQAIINARRVVGRAEALEDVTFYYFRTGPGGMGDREFTHRIDAKRAVLRPGFWQLEDVVENHVGGEANSPDQGGASTGVAMKRMPTRALQTNLRDDTLLQRFASSKTIPFWDLPDFIADGRAAGMDVDAYVLKLHTLLATPIFMVAMSMIGAIVCLRLARAGGLTQLIGAGALAGFVLFFITRLAAGMSASGATSPEVAAWCPPLFALFSVLTLLAHAEDG